MRFSRIISLFILCMLLFTIITGCSNAIVYDPNQYDFEHDDQYYFTKLSASYPSVAKSADGYYFFSGESNSYLYYMDKKTMNPVILCNKPECLHAEESDSQKRERCNAFFYQSNNLIYYNQNLYAIGFDPESLTGGLVLTRISLDGTSQKVVAKFKDAVQRLIIHRGFIYYAVDDLTSDSNDTVTQNTCEIYRISMDKTEAIPEPVFNGKGFGGIIGYLAGYKGNIYFLFLQYTDSTLMKLSSSLYKYSITGGKPEMIKENVSSFAFCNDQLVCSDINRNVEITSLDGTNAGTIQAVAGYPMGADDYIYVYQADSSGDKLVIYDWKGHVISDYGKIAAKCMPYGGDELYFFMEDEHNQSVSGNSHIIYMIDKRKLPESTEPKKIFEYVPKIQ